MLDSPELDRRLSAYRVLQLEFEPLAKNIVEDELTFQGSDFGCGPFRCIVWTRLSDQGQGGANGKANDL
jgi:hypothetical protein